MVDIDRFLGTMNRPSISTVIIHELSYFAGFEIDGQKLKGSTMSLTACLDVCGAEDRARAEVALAALGVTLVADPGSDGGDRAMTVVGSWQIAKAQRLVSDAQHSVRSVVVRGIGLLEYCVANPCKHELLTRAATQCILNTALRTPRGNSGQSTMTEVVCFSGITGAEKAGLMFKVEVGIFVPPHSLLLVSGCCSGSLLYRVVVCVCPLSLYAMQAMGGNVEASLNNEVTVVVAKDMTSDKCRLALKLAADKRQVFFYAHNPRGFSGRSCVRGCTRPPKLQTSLSKKQAHAKNTNNEFSVAKQEIAIVHPSWLEACIKSKSRANPREFRIQILPTDYVGTTGVCIPAHVCARTCTCTCACAGVRQLQEFKVKASFQPDSRILTAHTHTYSIYTYLHIYECVYT